MERERIILGIRRLTRPNTWAAVSVKLRADGTRCVERLLAEYSGPGSKARAIQRAGTNAVV